MKISMLSLVRDELSPPRYQHAGLDGGLTLLVKANRAQDTRIVFYLRQLVSDGLGVAGARAFYGLDQQCGSVMAISGVDIRIAIAMDLLVLLHEGAAFRNRRIRIPCRT